jgi:hypothetical protein
MDKHTEIAECAYHIWLIQGCPEGKALEHWLQAEAEVAPKTRKQNRPAVLVPVKAEPALSKKAPAAVHHSPHRDAA